MVARRFFVAHLRSKNLAVSQKHDVHMTRTWWHMTRGDEAIERESCITIIFSKQINMFLVQKLQKIKQTEQPSRH